MATCLSIKRRRRIAEHGRRWRQIKDLEEDYQVYVSDEYAHHISENGLTQDVMRMSNRVEYDETLKLRTGTHYKPSRDLTFAKPRNQRMSTEMAPQPKEFSINHRFSGYQSSEMGDAGNFHFEKQD